MSTLPLTERDFQTQVTQLAELRNWEWVHCRAGRTVDSWRTPMSGTMAKGFPDLLLCRGKRIIVVELKRNDGKLTMDQVRVLDVLGLAVEAYCWRPKDWDFIEQELR